MGLYDDEEDKRSIKKNKIAVNRFSARMTSRIMK